VNYRCPGLRRPTRRGWPAFGAGALIALAAACGWSRARTAPPGPAGTAVSGPSWVGHLGLSVETSELGRLGGGAAAPDVGSREPSGGPFALTGADLYRLDCQSCHGADGAGHPPEVNSLLGPVQGSSEQLVRKRLAARGAAADESLVRQLTQQARADLIGRLRDGGKKMPPFGWLRAEEREALLARLDELAGVPGALQRQRQIRESEERTGELLVKGTCHICHDATGPFGPGMRGMGMMGGGGAVIPSLASIPAHRSLGQVIRKVREGLGGPMGMMGGGRMPALPYLTPAEVAAAYRYLRGVSPGAETPELASASGGSGKIS
jgi:mono/diheme cytochrome c family protein